MRTTQNKIAIVTRDTRMQGLLQRWSTKGAARFRLAQAHLHLQVKQEALRGTSSKTTGGGQAVPIALDAEFEQYEQEDRNYHTAVNQVRRDLDFGYPIEIVDRQYLSNYDFGRTLVVVVIGQDGLVANTAKYVGELPIVAINPEPARFDGILLPFRVSDSRRAVKRVLDGQARVRRVSLAEAILNDGQRILAFNDLLIGMQGHTSARYILRTGLNFESQSSSGVIVSTGAGSTGWFSSVCGMAAGVTRWLGGEPQPATRLEWEARSLLWAVREPFQSKSSQANLVAGELAEGETLTIESLMAERGVIFSDGVEADFLEFNSGSIATIRCAEQQASLVV